MLFRNSVRLLLENFKNVYKILLYKLIILLVAFALCTAIILPQLLEIVNSAPMQDLISGGQSFFTALFSADAARLGVIKEELFGANGALHRLIALLSTKTVGIVLVIVGCLLVYLIKRFFDTLCYFAVGGVLNDKMSTYAETPLGASYVKNFGRACCYALVYVPIAFAIEAAALVLCYFALRFLNILISLFLSVTLIVLAQTLKFTFTGRSMPAMITDGARLRNSFRYVDKTEKKQQAKAFSVYLVSVYAVVIVNVIAAIFTFGSALIITIPVSYFLFICEQFTHYYTIQGKKYFITYERIASNPDRGDREHFFDYIDEIEDAKEDK